MSPTLKQLDVGSRVVIAGCLLAFIVIEYVRPFVADLYYQDDFRRLVVHCDQAMHDEAALRTRKSSDDVKLALSADVQLAVCHDYDKLRKRLLGFGVSENQLALRSLEALETDQIPVSRMVDPHRMDRF